MIKLHDIATNEVIEREMNDEEFAQYKLDQATNADVLAQQANRAAIFEKLGLSVDEAKLLLS